MCECHVNAVCLPPKIKHTPVTKPKLTPVWCTLPWSLAYLAHIICWHTHTSEFRIDLYLFPAQPPHGWCPSVIGGTVQLPSCKARQPVHLHFLYWSPFGGIQGCKAEPPWLDSDLCVPLLKASCFNLLPLQNCVPLYYSKGQLEW